MRTALLLPALTALLAATAACSSKSSDGNTSGGPGAGGNTNNTGTLPGCPTAATMKAELGLDVNEPTTEGSGGAVLACRFTPAPGSSGNAIVRFQGKYDATQFATAKEIFKKSGQPIADLTGVGDEAYSSTLTAGRIVNNTVIARKGSLEVLITCQASLEQEKAFANKLLG